MLISSWLTTVRNRLQDRPRTAKRRVATTRAAKAAENLETRALLTSLVAVRPNVGAFFSPGETRNIAPQELTLQFSLGEAIDASSISSSSIQVERAGHDGTFGDGNEVSVGIGYVGIGNDINEVVLRFAHNLPNDHYRITVKGTGSSPLTSDGGTVFNAGVDMTFDFNLDLGAQIVAVDPQPVVGNNDGTVSQPRRDQIVLYFNEDKLNPLSAEDPSFYQLIFTNDTVTTADDFGPGGIAAPHLPTSAVYNPAANTVTLTFADDIENLSGAGTYRLRVGTAESIPQAPNVINPGDPGDSYATANTQLGIISNTGNQGHLIRQIISPQFYPIVFPGGDHYEPGHRDVEVQHHVDGPDTSSGTTQIPYNFRTVYGVDPSGNVLNNAITEAQKQRAREIFEYYSNLLGIDFWETDSSGLTIVTGDLRALDPDIPTGPGGVAGLAGSGMAIMDLAENWGDLPGESWFNVAMHEIGHLLGLGHTYELPGGTLMGSDGSINRGPVEPVYPGDHDIVHGQYLHRPDSIDIDLYRFEVQNAGLFSAEVMAERLPNSSRLDSHLRLFRQNADGSREMVAQNDDYFSEDAYLELLLEPGIYFIGVSSTGNDVYDPTIANTGMNGTSIGTYEMRVNFRPGVTNTIVDTTGTAFDGNSDGTPGGVYNFWFRAVAPAETLFVNKAAISTLSGAITAGATQIVVQSISPFAVGNVIRVNNEQMQITAINPVTRALTVVRGFNATTPAAHSARAVVKQAAANGSAALPFGLISDAIQASTAGQIIRVVGNGGADGELTTVADNNPYQIGFDAGNQPLQDGTTLEVPRGVTLMIDGGAVFKLRRALIGVGSSSTGVNRSGSALQVLGTPDRQVIFTSWADESIGTDTSPSPTNPQPGDWGGISYRNAVDRAQNNFNYENEAIFLNYVAHADLRWGGGNVVLDSVLQTINPIHIVRSQPTIVHNTISHSSDSAMSADPDSFEEMSFHSPRFQEGVAPFTVDYNRVGPDIYGNTLVNNSTNGLFVRVVTAAGDLTRKLTVPGRFDDTDIVHVIAQNLEIQGTPGGPLLDQTPPAVNLVTLTPTTGGALTDSPYNYRIAFVDENGFEGPTSVATGTQNAGVGGAIALGQLPPATGAYNGRRIYRSAAGGGGPYLLVAELDRSATTFIDRGGNLGRTLVPLAVRGVARIDARLSIDPGMIVKLEGARIESEVGAQFIAEGLPGRQVIFTSRLDDRYGASGTFDTNNDDNNAVEATPAAGNWGGIYVGHMGSASIDHALITFAGGVVPLEGNFAGFNPLEIHQASARISNTVFERNAQGTGGTAQSNRFGLFPNSAGTIFVRGAQPVIIDNVFRDNSGPVISINVNALNHHFVVDTGRSTGFSDHQTAYGDNQGPLVRDNLMGRNTINGMLVRGGTLTTQGVWDDTDIVHVVLDEIYVPDFHTYGGLRLESSPTQSLVIKLLGTSAGFSANGTPLDIVDRIGGMLHIIGQPGQPVVFTSLRDDSVGAGFDLSGQPLRDTNNNGPSTGIAGDWRSISIEPYAHDRNVAVYVEREAASAISPDTNGNVSIAEVIGALAANQKSGDENLRLGFEVHGFIDNNADIDVYSFSAVGGTHVWLDIDRTTHAFDSVVELLDANGQIIAQSDNTWDEEAGTWQVVTSPAGNVTAKPLSYSPYKGVDLYSTNQRDAGFRVTLPGTAGVRTNYFIRVRSSNIDSTNPGANRADLQDPAKLDNGLTSGVYQLQLRLQETDEFAGTTIQYADIRFANTGIQIIGQPIHSPLAGESEEVEPNNTGATGNQLGNLMDTDRAALAVRGRIASNVDIDFFQFEVNYQSLQTIAGVSLAAPHVPVVFDIDYADGLARADLTLSVFDSTGRLILIGRDSNIADDQPGPLEGTDMDDLSRGSVGKFDPFIGTVELPGGVYTVAVSNNRVVPQAMDQFWFAASANPLVRLEPINSVNRIAEERFNTVGGDTFTTANPPATDLFTVTVGGQLDPKHVVPFHLGDLSLFVSINGGITGTNETTIVALNPFTGDPLTTLGQFGPSIGDIAMRPDGHLYAFSTSPQGTGLSNSGNTGNYLQIDTGTAAITVIGDDGIVTNLDNLNPGDDTVVAHANAGIRFNAMTYTGTGDTNLFAVGDRFDNVPLPANSNIAYQYNSNILYRFDIRTGAVSGNGADRPATGSQAATQGAGTTQREMGRIDTTPYGGGTVTGLASISGQLYAVDNLGNLFRITQNGVILNQYTIGGGGINFAGLVAGPDEVEGGRYANMLFAMSTGSILYAFNTTGVLQPVFVDGATQTFRGVGGQITGLAFGTLDRNLWNLTTNRGTDSGHGVETRFDDSVLEERQNGGRSLYFGNTRTGAAAGNKNDLNTGAINNVNFPGGAHGTVVSNTFDLTGYAAGDKPTLYFNYLLQTENAQFNPAPDPDDLMRDSFRVFVADDSGQWNLLSTNNSFQSATEFDEFDYGAGSPPTSQTHPKVVETFDNTATWRQARIDLSNYAGRSNLKLRFDFSTAGSMGVGNEFHTGSELRAIAGEKLRDGQTFSIDGLTFEFDMGATLIVPSGAAVDGSSFTVNAQTFTYSSTLAGPGYISITPEMTSQQVAAATAAAVGGLAVLPPTPGSRVNFAGLSITGVTGALVVDGAAGIAGVRPVVVNSTMTASQVALVIRQALADVWSGGDITNIKGHEDLIRVIGHTITSAGPLGVATSLPGDTFGAFDAGFNPNFANRPGMLRGMNNAVEGVYIDDIIIGFAERGEMFINAPAGNTGFINNRDILNAAYPEGNTYQGISVGEYDLEIRRASDYAETVDESPTNFLYKGIDTNDREAQLASIDVSNAAGISNGAFLVISDGIEQVTFQFIDQSGPVASIPGAFVIPFTSQSGPIGNRTAETAWTLAARLRTAINSPQVQGIIRVKASHSDGVASGGSSTSARLHLTGNAIITTSSPLTSGISVIRYDAYGDRNHYRDQGQLIIQSSLISDSAQFGIFHNADLRAGAPQRPHPGSVRNTQEINTSRLVTGVVIMNNVLAANAAGGIRFSGDEQGNPFGQVPYGRIVNNTIAGTGVGTGILVEQSASPTILNNIVANLATGISVDASSVTAGTVIGATLYRGNTTNTATGAIGLGTFPIVLTPAEPLFVDQANRNYYPAPQSRAIDSSLNSLGDRADLTQVKGPLGLGISPILAPSLDVYGQLRGDDPQVAPPAGQGANVFVDRGAIDRVDFFQPTAVLVAPEDQSSIDLDGSLNTVWINLPDNLRQFRVRLVDEGIGIDDANVSSSQFQLLIDGTPMVEGTDYVFTYNSVTDEAIFSAVTFFPFERRYTIIVDNDNATGDGVNGVRDRAGNYLLPNEPDGSTQFQILVTDGINDPPINTVPGDQTTNEDTTLVFSNATSNSISVSDADVHLGSNVLLITLTATNGTLTLADLSGLTFFAGDGTNDVTMTFEGDVDDLNAALNGLQFIPTPDYFGPASLTITTDDQGQFTGPPSPPEQTTSVINITVASVNDPPVFDPVTNPPVINEDAGPQSVLNFLTGMSAGPANEPQALTAEVTVVSTTGAWSTADFFAPGGAPAIDPLTGELTYTTAVDVNGTATIQVILRDSELLGSTPQTFVISVTAINDQPFFTLTPAAASISSLEDAGLQTVGVIQTSAAGPATALDEASQTLQWILGTPVVLSGNLQFDLLEVQPNGTLHYIASADTAGVAEFTLQLQDSGSDIPPNVNVSSTVTLAINVTQVNDAPVAATPDYELDEGYQLILDASGSYDVDAFFGDTLTFEWDLNGNSIDGFETFAGSSPLLTVSWAYLQSIGITAPGEYSIRLRVTDAFGPLSDIATATLTTRIVDYGDAPNSFGTLRASNGAAHTIVGDLFLGTSVDKEMDGQPNATATGDDNSGIDDEDGVVFTTSLESTAGMALPTFVTVTASAAGKLDAWIDLNFNGVFDHASEHLNGGVSYDVVAGENRIEFLIPAGTLAGDTFMRFRLSSAGSLLPTGRADDGEVEDYAVKIRPLQVAVTPTVIKPVDAVPADGLIAETSDPTPLIEWTRHDANYRHNVEVRDAGGNVVYSLSQTFETTAQLTTPLSAGTYTVLVTAFNRADVPAAVATYQFKVVPIVVTSPSGSVTTHQPVVEWNPVAGSKSYSIEIVSQATNTTVHIATINVNPLVPGANPQTYTVPVVLPLGQYRVRVRATDFADLPGDWSSFTPFFVQAGTTISAPAAVVSTNRPTVTWTAVPGAVSYELHLDNVTDNNRPAYLISGLTSLSWTPPADLPLAAYTVWVRAFNALGEASVWGPGRNFTVAPQASANVPTGRLNDSTPTFGWNSMLGADRYELVVRRAWGDLGIVVNQTGLTTTSFTQPVDLPLGRYTYQVRAINLAATGAQVNVASTYSPVYTFVIATAPQIVAPASTVFNNQPAIQWVNPLGSELNDIWVQQVGGTYEYYRVNGVSGTSHVPTSVFDNGNYVVWVRTYSDTDNPSTAADEREPSNWSLGKAFRISTPPTVLSPSGRTTDQTPTLTWQGVPGGQTYEVWIDNNSVPLVKIVNVAGLNTLSYTVPNNLPIGRYTFWVRARNAFGVDSNWSVGRTFDIVTAPVLSGPPASTFNTTPTISWNNMSTTVGGKAAGASSYEFQLEIFDTATSRYVVMPERTIAGLTTTSYTMTPPLAAGTYRAWVRAKVNSHTGNPAADLQGNFSAPLTFVVGGRPFVNPIPSPTGSTPVISWQAVGGASGYQIWISLASTPNTALILQNTGNSSYTVPAPLASGDYRVWVRAINSANGAFSPWSVPVNFTVAEMDLPSRFDSPVASDLLYAAMSAASIPGVTSESAISMLPAVVTDASNWPVSSTLIVEQPMVTVEIPAEEQVLVPNSPENAVTDLQAAETDAVLSGWDQNTWWDFGPVQQQPENSSSSDGQAAGVLGAMLALTPKSLRRRRRE